MKEQTEFRRYLANVDSDSTSQRFTDCLVIGAGIAGLRAAIEAAGQQKVVVACKGSLQDSNTWHAQGGIASVLEKDDSINSHIKDTLATGCGLCDENTVELVVKNGPELIKQLLDWGVEFDFEEGHLVTTIEGGHSHSRIAHAHGDETGRMIAEVLIRKVKANPNITILENFFSIDLLTNGDDNCVGVIGKDEKGLHIIWAANTILATGGAGMLFRETTNPEVATGDGLAMAYRAGAVLTDMEFMQFHPTTLYIAGASRALMSETLRGEGGILVDAEGNQFMKDYHENAELAPRDIVSRAILSHMLKTGATHVYLDVRHFDKEHFAERFPLISEICESFDIDISKDLIPVRPSAHYMVGGVKTDSTAKTSIENLFACGEIAATGLHGANRLGSNSLLEGLVFGKTAGQQSCQVNRNKEYKRPKIKYDVPRSDRTRLDTEDVTNSLRALMWRNIGITRTEKQLAEAQEIIRFWQRYVMDKVFESRQGWQCQNMLTTSLLMAKAARQRQESRGVHYRCDFPETDDANFKKHIEISRNI
ncbi:MAG: L-aspartate oxidase [Sedimentisphaerales bacterium]|nr:L-aspartate oxidase [Sedimentisphaerales bacterium]